MSTRVCAVAYVGMPWKAGAPHDRLPTSGRADAVGPPYVSAPMVQTHALPQDCRQKPAGQIHATPRCAVCPASNRAIQYDSAQTQVLCACSNDAQAHAWRLLCISAADFLARFFLFYLSSGWCVACERTAVASRQTPSFMLQKRLKAANGDCYVHRRRHSRDDTSHRTHLMGGS